MLSIIVPVLDEAESLPELTAQIRDTCRQHDVEYELIFIDDGSTDGSWQVIADLADGDVVSGIRFRRNFGKAAALTAGMRAARGDRILMMDSDLQDDPAEIPRLLAKLDEGYDVVNGWKQRRLDPWHKVYPSKVFNWLASTLSGLKLHDHNCGLKLFRREVAAEIRIYGELHRFISILAHARGFRVAELAVNHRRRQYGTSKYGFVRFLRGFLDLLTIKFLTGYGQRPQHLLGVFGLGCMMLGLLGLGYLSVVWILTNVFDAGFDPIGSRPLLAYSVAAVLLGAQALSLGLLAELFIAYIGRESDSYSVGERTGVPVGHRDSLEV
ncbi:MAG: glycosyltransferase family 2 protein [Planctomycetaceae bacterium]